MILTCVKAGRSVMTYSSVPGMLQLLLFTHVRYKTLRSRRRTNIIQRMSALNDAESLGPMNESAGYRSLLNTRTRPAKFLLLGHQQDEIEAVRKRA